MADKGLVFVVSSLLLVSCCLVYVVVDNKHIKSDLAALQDRLGVHQRSSSLYSDEDIMKRVSRQSADLDSSVSSLLNKAMSAWFTTNSNIVPIVKCTSEDETCKVEIASDDEVNNIRNVSQIMKEAISQLIDTRIEYIFSCNIEIDGSRGRPSSCCSCVCQNNDTSSSDLSDGIVASSEEATSYSTTESISLVQCGSPPAVRNGYNTIQSENYNVGQNVTYSCDYGYTMEGSPSVTCLEGAEWSTPPNCTAIDCGTPRSISNGNYHSLTSTRVGGTARYSCQIGYNLTPESGTVKCSVYGYWTLSPHCEIVDCGDPPPIENGRYLYHRTTYGQAAEYTCNSGYDKGVSRTRCLFDGRWSFQPTCIARRPSDPCDDSGCEQNCTPNGSYSYYCSCRLGYSLNGDRHSCTYIGYFG